MSLANIRLMNITQLALTQVWWPNSEKTCFHLCANSISTKVRPSHHKSTQRSHKQTQVFNLHLLATPFVQGLISVKWRLKTKENFSLSSKVVMVASKRWSLSRSSKYSDQIENFWYFGKLVNKQRWSLTAVVHSTTGGSTV